MKIAILSDVHDHRDHLVLFIEYVRNPSHMIDYILHLGDYGAPGACVQPLMNLGIPITGIWGNNDGEKRKIMKLFENTPHADMLRTIYGDIELDGKKIFMIHYDDIYDTIARSGDYDLVLYGHSHMKDLHTIGDTLVCNPGAICGNFEPACFVVYDTKENKIEHIELN